MTLITYEPVEADENAFVMYWAARYQDYDDDSFYTENVGRELNEQRILAWYEWKNGTPLSESKLRSVIANYVNRRAELDEISSAEKAEHFLARFDAGGAIWRTFWLHLWQPTKFPIYDMHVHRAMRFIQSGAKEEISGKADSVKIRLYVDQYLPFYARFDGINHREVDKALWFYGKFLSENKFPADPKST